MGGDIPGGQRGGMGEMKRRIRIGERGEGQLRGREGAVRGEGGI